MSSFQYGAHVRANGIRQHYLRYGGNTGPRASRDAMIIVPGITSPAVTWGFVGERFGREFDTYVLDVRGRGLSEASDALDYSLTAQADDLAAFAEALGLSRFAVIGHSMGGRIGARMAGRSPGRLSRLVLLDPPVSGPGRRPYPAQLPWYVDSMALARQGTDAEGMRPYCPTWNDEHLRIRAEWLHTCDERAIRVSFDGFQADDIHADLAKVRVPTLLMTAERGDVVRPEDVEEITGLIPGLRHRRVAGAGHMIPYDNEEGFYQAFEDFLGARLD